MPTATEVVAVPLREGHYPDDPASGTGPKFDELFQTILSQDGAQRLYWAQQLETPSVLSLFIDWDSVDHHNKFMASE
jgi:hypothetical protein